MKISEIEYTPNPNAVKFILRESLTPFGTHGEFHSVEEAESVPLAKAIFDIEHVVSLYYTDRWLTVTQDGQANWHELMRKIADPIRSMTPADASLGEAMLREKNIDLEGMDGLDADPRLPFIKELIDMEIMPFLQGDGGGLQIMGLVDNQLLIRYQGACGTCPASSTGTLAAIENLVQTSVDPMISVVAI